MTGGASALTVSNRLLAQVTHPELVAAMRASEPRLPLFRHLAAQSQPSDLRPGAPRGSTTGSPSSFGAKQSSLVEGRPSGVGLPPCYRRLRSQHVLKEPNPADVSRYQMDRGFTADGHRGPVWLCGLGSAWR
jgi:hypothetical protein